MPPIKINGPARNGNYRKELDPLPDIEDFGKVLKNYSLQQEKNIDRSQNPEGQNCQTCSRADAVEKIVRNSGKSIEQGSPASGKEYQHIKYDVQQSKAHGQALKQNSQTGSSK